MTIAVAADAPLRLVFAGTPDFAATHLAALLASRHRIVAVYTQPDRPAGRGKKLAASPVKQLALNHQLPVYQPATLRTPTVLAELAALAADVMVVVAYGLLLPQSVLATPRLGCINVHASLLPRWRGAAPIQRAIAAGDRETGICIMQMEAGLDTGPVLKRVVCPIAADDTSATLLDKLAALGGAALLQALDELDRGTATPEPQDDERATYAAKLTKAEAELDWRLGAYELDRRIRAFNPQPVAFTRLNGEPLRIWRALPDAVSSAATPGTLLAADRTGLRVACGEGTLRLTMVQLPGKSPLPVADLLNSRAGQLRPGVVLGACRT